MIKIDLPLTGQPVTKRITIQGFDQNGNSLDLLTTSGTPTFSFGPMSFGLSLPTGIASLSIPITQGLEADISVSAIPDATPGVVKVTLFLTFINNNGGLVTTSEEIWLNIGGSVTSSPNLRALEIVAL